MPRKNSFDRNLRLAGNRAVNQLGDEEGSRRRKVAYQSKQGEPVPAKITPVFLTRKSAQFEGTEKANGEKGKNGQDVRARSPQSQGAVLNGHIMRKLRRRRNGQRISVDF